MKFTLIHRVREEGHKNTIVDERKLIPTENKLGG